MEADNHGQLWTVWFLCRGGVAAPHIHTRLAAVCGEAAPSRRTVFRWIAEFKDGKDCAERGKNRGLPATACTPDSTQRVSDLILENRLIPFDELENATGLSSGTVHTIIHQDLKMKKVCAQ
ncbi:protein GVQW3-like [Cryptotermes secundus]|uniref:protein GVQW3-like n=1 Tax=Cryptotermes secundus TaxID=105785 RepID=UPI000CD7B8AA|nr:protein GVQW3-like [Cryptotermes secundus]